MAAGWLLIDSCRHGPPYLGNPPQRGTSVRFGAGFVAMLSWEYVADGKFRGVIGMSKRYLFSHPP
jgi:hypothetical protein